MLVEGGLTGLVVVLLSYIYQLPEPVPPQLSELSPQIQAWFRRGSLVDILDKKMFVLTQGQSHLIHIVKQWTSEIYFLYIKYLPNSKIFQTSCSSIRSFSSLGIQYFFLSGSAKETIILIHGFPTSSFDYFDVIDQLSERYRVVVFDHIGFGFSDKPSNNYTYSLLDQAEQALALWTRLGIKWVFIMLSDTFFHLQSCLQSCSRNKPWHGGLGSNWNSLEETARNVAGIFWQLFQEYHLHQRRNGLRSD